MKHRWEVLVRVIIFANYINCRLQSKGKIKIPTNSIIYENYRTSKKRLTNNKTIIRFRQSRQNLFCSFSQSRNIRCSSLTSFSKYDLRRLFCYIEVKIIRNIIFSINIRFPPCYDIIFSFLSVFTFFFYFNPSIQ